MLTVCTLAFKDKKYTDNIIYNSNVVVRQAGSKPRIMFMKKCGSTDVDNKRKQSVLLHNEK